MLSALYAELDVIMLRVTNTPFYAMLNVVMLSVMAPITK